MNRITKEFPKYLSGYIMEECLNHIVTHAPYIWSHPVLPNIAYQIMSRFRNLIIFVFKPHTASLLATERGETETETADIAF